MFYKKKFTDIIGTKLYRKNTIQPIIPKTSGQGFDFELVSLICKKNLRVEEVNIKYTPRQNSSEKKIKFYHLFNALYAILITKLKK